MLDIQLLRNDIDVVAQKLKLKKFELNKEEFQTLDAERKKLQIKTEELQSLRNNFSKMIGQKKTKGEDTTELMQQVNANNLAMQENEKHLELIQNKIHAFIAHIPNLPDLSTPLGNSDADNLELKKAGIIPSFNFVIKDHVDLGLLHKGGVDFETGAKLSGSRFAVLKGEIAKIHRALSQFMSDIHTQEHNYEETYVPYLVNGASMFGTGQLPKFAQDMFHTKRENDDMYLIPTAEVPLTNMYAEMILSVNELPINHVAHSPCFRSEAGSYGRDTRGLIRVHQFDKVELVQIVKPEISMNALDELLSHACKILDLLELPYRVVQLCGGDLTFCSAKTYDIEVWVPSQNTYREISSCSNMTDFQARRMNARFKDIDGKNKFVHTLNGSGLAVGRTLVALMENNQNEDGSINIPKILQKYTNFSRTTVLK